MSVPAGGVWEEERGLGGGVEGLQLELMRYHQGKRLLNLFKRHNLTNELGEESTQYLL